MSYRCNQCERAFSGEPTETITGRELCPTCNDQLMGLAAGLMVAGGDADGGVGNAISTAGWFGRVRWWKRNG